MPKFRINATGVVVSVSDETAKRLDAGYSPVEGKKPARKATSAKKADSSDDEK